MHRAACGQLMALALLLLAPLLALALEAKGQGNLPPAFTVLPAKGAVVQELPAGEYSQLPQCLPSPPPVPL